MEIIVSWEDHMLFGGTQDDCDGSLFWLQQTSWLWQQKKKLDLMESQWYMVVVTSFWSTDKAKYKTNLEEN